jgi:hypothetical protein
MLCDAVPKVVLAKRPRTLIFFIFELPKIIFDYYTLKKLQQISTSGIIKSVVPKVTFSNRLTGHKKALA